MRLPKRERVAVPTLPISPTTNGKSSRTPRSRRQARRTTTSSRNTRTLRRHLLCAPGRVRLEAASPRLLLALAETAHHYFRAWRIDGTWERIHTVLRERLRRLERAESLPRARRSSTPRRPRLPRREALLADTMVPRR